ncbi:MAG: tetratricopeptide repeat protein [Candidatus Thermoplasmatota archaeon]|nr:tetratricopeptide repeat protein [Candidatus Thermoplasmatota archaeon]
MVELDKILDERSDDRIIGAVLNLPDQEFSNLVEKVLGYLELKMSRSRLRETFVIADCIHRSDDARYAILFSRREQPLGRGDVESLISYMEKTGASSALVFTTASILDEAVELMCEHSIGFADGKKLIAILRRFDLDKEVLRITSMIPEVVVAEHPAISGERLEDAMKAGYDALASKDFMRALEAFDLAILVDENYDVPWRLKGVALDEMGYHEQALECYKHALELLPESDDTWFALGNCFFALSRYTEEIMCYDKALFYNPMMQKALINKGSTLHRLGRYQEALLTYDKVLKINYRLEKVHNNKGATLHALNRQMEALESYDRAIELKHDYVEAWMNKGNLLYMIGRYEEALESFTQVTRFRPEYPKGWYLRGMVSKKLGKVTQANSVFEQALQLDPDYVDARKALGEVKQMITEQFVEVPRIAEDIFLTAPDAPAKAEPETPTPVMAEDVVVRVQEPTVEQLADELYGDRAQLLLLLGRHDEAFEFLGKSLRLEGEDPSLLTAAGNVLFRQGKIEAAIRSYEHALSIDGSHVPALMNLHNALMEMGEWEKAHGLGEALRDSSAGWQGHALAAIEARHRGDSAGATEEIDDALATENLAMLLNYRGLTKLECDDLDGAAEAFERAVALPLDRSEACNNLGVVILKKGEFEKASLEVDRAIRHRKNDPAAWNNRGCILYKRDRMREAIACFDESLLIAPSTVAMTNKGFVQLTLDMLPEALSSFEQSIRLAETPEGYNNKGIVLMRMSKMDDARVSLKDALRLAPKFGDASSNLKRAESAPPGLGNTPTATEDPIRSPRLEVVGGNDASSLDMDELTPKNLRKKRKAELEAICDAFGVSARGTKSELVSRILRSKRQAPKK